MSKIPVRTQPLRHVEAVLGANAKNDADGYLTAQIYALNPFNPAEGYMLSDKDDDASPNYYGYVSADGAWYILEETLIAGADTYRFAKGSTDYITNWGNRTTLGTYDYFYTTF